MVLHKNYLIGFVSRLQTNANRSVNKITKSGHSLVLHLPYVLDDLLECTPPDSATEIFPLGNLVNEIPLAFSGI